MNERKGKEKNRQTEGIVQSWNGCQLPSSGLGGRDTVERQRLRTRQPSRSFPARLTNNHSGIKNIHHSTCHLQKRQKIQQDPMSADEESSDLEGVEPHEDEVSDSSSSADSDADDDISPDTDTEIAALKPHKSKKTLKRKRRAIAPPHFAQALQSLLAAPAPSAPLGGKRRHDERLEARGRKVLVGERKEKEEKGHVRDVVGGWGAEGERALRKVAQRGGKSVFFHSDPCSCSGLWKKRVWLSDGC